MRDEIGYLASRAAIRKIGYRAAMEPLLFEWDPEKAASNERKHGVTFELAKQVFDDPFATDGLDDLIDYEEERFITIGMVGLQVLVVVWTGRGELVRLISARRATKWEANEYFDQIR